MRKITFNDVYGVCVRVPRGRLSALELSESRVYEFPALGSRLLEPTAFTLGIAVSTTCSVSMFVHRASVARSQVKIVTFLPSNYNSSIMFFSSEELLR